MGVVVVVLLVDEVVGVVAPLTVVVVVLLVVDVDLGVVLVVPGTLVGLFVVTLGEPLLVMVTSAHP